MKGYVKMVLDLLTKEDHKNIFSTREYYASKASNGNNEFCSNNYFLSYWNNEKSLFLSSIFNSSLILEKEIFYQIDSRTLIQNLEDMFHNFYDENGLNYYDYFYEQFSSILEENIDLEKTRQAEHFLFVAYDTIQSFRGLLVRHLITSFALANKTFSRFDSVTIYFKNREKPYVLKKGAKITRVIGQLCKILDIYDKWEPLRIKISQVTNVEKIKGTLCLSIHPLDYITASINNNDWSSCMNFDDGDYREGVIEMMNAPYIVVAYIRSEKDFDFITFPWNNKKWREFFYVSPTVVCGIKGYPYDNKDLEKICLNWFKELIEAKTDIHYSRTVYEFLNNEYINFENNKITFSFDCGPAMYNDFNSDKSMFQGYFNLKYAEKQYNNTTQSFFYSGVPECMCCGKTIESVVSEGESYILCDECAPVFRCINCNSEFYGENYGYWLGDNWYCERCYNELPYCESCGEKYDPESFGSHETMVETSLVRDVPEKENIVEKISIPFCLCDECTSKYFKDYQYQEARRNINYGEGLNFYQYLSVVHAKNLTEDGKIYFEDRLDRQIDSTNFVEIGY